MTTTAPLLLGHSRDVATLQRVRERLFFEATLDDVESVLTEYCDLTARDFVSLEPRLYKTLHQLFRMASLVTPPSNPLMMAQAEQLLVQPFPSEDLAALGHLRRMAVIVQELLP